MPDPVALDGNIRCLSAVSNIRCQNLSTLQHIAIFIPVGLELVLVPLILRIAWHRPHPTLLLLTIELLLSIASAGWDLAIVLDRPSQSTFQIEDIALGAVSSLTTLFLLLTTTSIFLSTFRPVLPPLFRSAIFTNLFALVFLPLVPIGFIATLLGDFLLLVYRRASHGRGMTVGFANGTDEWTHTIIYSTGAIATATYTLFITTISLYILLSHPCRDSYKTRHPHRPLTSLGLISSGLFFSAGDTLMTLLPDDFPILLSRQILHLVSRTLLTGGLVLSYFSKLSSSASQTDLFNSKDREKSRRQELEYRRTGSSFGTPMPITPTHVPIWRRGTKNSKTSSRKSKGRGREKGGKSGMSVATIGAPVLATFKRLSTEATREFHALRSDTLKVGPGMLDGSAMPSTPIGRVVFRTPKARAPVLSFTPSTFSTTISNLANMTLEPTTKVHPRAAEKHPFARQDDTIEVLPDCRSFNPSTTTKKYVGSIYRPDRISVEESELAVWPLPPKPARASLKQQPSGNYGFDDRLSDIHSSAGPIYPIGIRPLTYSDYPNLWNRISKRASGLMRIGTVNGGRRGDIVPIGQASTSTPRSNSIKRKPVPILDVSSAYPATVIGDFPAPPPRAILHAHQPSVEVLVVRNDGPEIEPNVNIEPHTPDAEPRLARRETDPSIAMDPDLTAQIHPSPAPTPSPDLQHSRPVTESTILPKSPSSPTPPMSPLSPVSGYSDADDQYPSSLFFATPTQSPTDSESHSPSTGSYVNYSRPNTGYSSDIRPLSRDPRLLLASLYRLQRDAGIEPDLNRLEMIREGDEDEFRLPPSRAAQDKALRDNSSESSWSAPGGPVRGRLRRVKGLEAEIPRDGQIREVRKARGGVI